MVMTLHQLAKTIPGSQILHAADTEFTHLACDSRKVKPGSAFFAVSGAAQDGHAFIPQALAAGATVIVAERMTDHLQAHLSNLKSHTSNLKSKNSNSPAPNSQPPAPISVILVPDSREAMAKSSAVFFGLSELLASKRLLLAAVTGTNGKTTTTYLLQAFFQASGQKCGRIGTVEYDTGQRIIEASNTTPGPLELAELLYEMANAGLSACAMEASSHALSQKRLDHLAPHVGIFTNLTGDHLDYHHTVGNYASAKGGLFDLLAPDGTALINADDPWAIYFLHRASARPSLRVWTFGVDHPADIKAEIQEMGAGGSKIKLTTPLGTAALHIPLVGRHNVYNVLGAAGAALALDIPFDTIASALAHLPQVPGRLQRVIPTAPLPPGGAGGGSLNPPPSGRGVGGGSSSMRNPSGPDFPSVFVDYAHSDDALANVLSALRPLVQTGGRLICLFGCGGDRDRTKRPRMAKIAEKLADWIIVTSDNPRTEDPQRIIAEIMAGFSRKAQGRVRVESDRREAIRLAIRKARPGDCVLLAGKGHENYQIFGQRKTHFDDVEEAQKALSSAL